MNAFADFHVHSTRSDGAFDIQTLINMARAAHIRYLAITDHNKLVPNIEVYQDENPDIVLITGSEISSTFYWNNGKSTEIHIVGLFMDHTKQLEDILKKNQTSNEDWIKKIITNLNNLGLEIGSYDDIQKCFPGRQVRRMLLAEAMVQKKLVPSIDVALDFYIGDRGKRLAWEEPCKIRYIPFKKAINTIHDANGIAVLAHPLSYVLSEQEREDLIRTFKQYGGDCLEVFYAAYSEEERKKVKLLADSFGLSYSCGSDFHGFSATDTLENNFPSEIYYQLLRKKRML